MKISRSALLPYSADQMFDVVADIPSYPKFLNWCKSAEVISETNDEVVARLTISYARLSFEFTTRNINNRGESIELNLVSGPLTSLTGKWTFKSMRKDVCKVEIDMRFDFDNTFAKRVIEKIFAKMVTTQIEAFQGRAKVLYGAR